MSLIEAGEKYFEIIQKLTEYKITIYEAEELQKPLRDFIHNRRLKGTVHSR